MWPSPAFWEPPLPERCLRTSHPDTMVIYRATTTRTHFLAIREPRVLLGGSGIDYARLLDGLIQDAVNSIAGKRDQSVTSVRWLQNIDRLGGGLLAGQAVRGELPLRYHLAGSAVLIDPVRLLQGTAWRRGPRRVNVGGLDSLQRDGIAHAAAAVCTENLIPVGAR
jgi:hypothetical protein